MPAASTDRPKRHLDEKRVTDSAALTRFAMEAQLALLIAMRDANVRNVALRAAGLSAEGLDMVRVLIERTRRLEGGHRSAPALGEDGSGATPVCGVSQSRVT